jgi:hypothetical protein
MVVCLISHAEKRCGVYQYGKMIAESVGMPHLLISQPSDLIELRRNTNIDVAVWNWHPSTLERYLEVSDISSTARTNICLLHEQHTFRMKEGIFNAYFFADPSSSVNYDNFYIIPRLVRDFGIGPRVCAGAPVIGSFGFGSGIKGYQRFIELVEDSFDEAYIRLHIPANWFVDPNGDAARRLSEYVARRQGGRYRFEISSRWMSDSDLVEWLAANDLNVFPYDEVDHPGISSSIDWALAARRPLAISRCGLFRHLHHLPIITPDRSLKQILESGTAPISHLWQKWSEVQFQEAWHRAIRSVTNSESPGANLQVGACSESNLATSCDTAFSKPKPEAGKASGTLYRRTPVSYSQAFQDLFVLYALQGKVGGRYLEVGANHPLKHNNTYLLSTAYDWVGVSIERSTENIAEWRRLRGGDNLVISDALQINYTDALDVWFDSGDRYVDYLQIDIEPSINTLSVLKNIPLEQWVFGVISFETDAYTGDLRARDESRSILARHGYCLACADVLVRYEGAGGRLVPFEDWWVHRSLYDAIRQDVENFAGKAGFDPVDFFTSPLPRDPGADLSASTLFRGESRG